MALSLAVFSGHRPPIPRSSSSPAIVTSSFQNMPRSIDHRKRRAAAYGQSLVSSPPHSTHLPNGTDNLTVKCRFDRHAFAVVRPFMDIFAYGQDRVVTLSHR